MWLAAGMGLRRGEAFGLTVDRVKFLERKVVVDRQLIDVGRGGVPVFGPPKTISSVREVPLPEFVAEALARHLKRFKPGPEGLAGFDFHELRHYYASLLIDSGASVKVVQARLGHKSAEETLNTYSHLWPDSDDRTRDAIDAALRADTEEQVAGIPDSLRTPTPNRGYHA